MRFKGKAIEPGRVKENVWYPKTSKVIAIIENGVFETADETVIDQLKELGYEIIQDEAPVIKEEKTDTPMATKRKGKGG
jgi:hypothetical protein